MANAAPIGTDRPAGSLTLPAGIAVFAALLFLLTGLAGYARPAVTASAVDADSGASPYVLSTDSVLDEPAAAVQEQPLLPIWLIHARQESGLNRVPETSGSRLPFALPGAPEPIRARYGLRASAAISAGGLPPIPSRLLLFRVLRI